MKKLLLSVLLYFTLTTLLAQHYEVTSPDSNLKLRVTPSPRITWSVYYKDKLVIDESEMTMKINDNVIGVNTRVQKKTERQHDGTITPVVAQKSSLIRDQYKELVIAFRGQYGVEFRVYNDGVAYRFTTAMKGDVVVHNETMKLAFPDNTMSLFPEEESLISHYERSYIVTKIDTLTANRFCSLPALMTVDNTVRVVCTEADLYDYPGLFLYGSKSNVLTSGFPKYVKETKPAPQGGDRNEIISTEDFIAKTTGTRTYPWRVFVITDDDRKLPESNLVFQLSRPTTLTDTDWIKPGKVAWDWYNANNIFGVDFKSGINTATYKYFIDFASAYGLEYVILDEGWSKTTTNVFEPNPDIDVEELVRYGAGKNVGIILWSLWKPVDNDAEKLFSLYERWGVKGVKIDFMQRADQYMVNYYTRVAEVAARHKLLVDYHGAFKPAGLRRAYPNVISYEGVKGNENNKWSADVTPEHNVTLPFIRMVAGPMDFTPGALRNAQLRDHRISHYHPMSLGTRCHQVAMYIVFESPLQMLCDVPSAYYKEKETTEFIAGIPSVWDETKVLEARVSDYIVTARRKGDTWYLGAMTDWSARDIEVDLTFLPEGHYQMVSMSDGVNADQTAQDYSTKTEKVNRQSKVKISMAPGGGWAAILSKE